MLNKYFSIYISHNHFLFIADMGSIKIKDYYKYLIFETAEKKLLVSKQWFRKDLIYYPGEDLHDFDDIQDFLKNHEMPSITWDVYDDYKYLGGASK